MRLLDKYKIGGHWLDVEIKTERQGYDKAASVYRWWNKIFIQSDLAQSKKESNLFHEVIEEINGQMDLDLTHRQISTLAESFYSFLTDNGLLKDEPDKQMGLGIF